MRRNLTVLIVGGGAREEALHQAIKKSPLVDRVLVAPGNGGAPAENRRAVQPSDTQGLISLTKDERVDLVVVGPEKPLVAGLVDTFKKEGIRVFGPTAAAARLEGSKIFTRRFCSRRGIPQPEWMATDNLERAASIIATMGPPLVVKADGPCSGKGVEVTDTADEALGAAHKMLVKRIYGEAGARIVIERRLFGRECSVMAFCDGVNAVPLPPARDYKRVRADDKRNTGGMGAYSPLSDVSDELLARIKSEIILPTVRGMAERGTPFHGLLYGLLYAGLMLTEVGPQLLEYNVRFGDPETQVVLPRIKNDVVPYILATLEPGGLSKLPPLTFLSQAAVCVNLVSEGYPGEYKSGFPITGVEKAAKHALVFHAATDRRPELVTTDASGRVMSVVGLGASVAKARRKANMAADCIHFQNKFRRMDIAFGV